MGPHHFESNHIGELERQQRRPPTDGQVFRIHTVGFAVLSDSVKYKLITFIVMYMERI